MLLDATLSYSSGLWQCEFESAASGCSVGGIYL